MCIFILHAHRSLVYVLSIRVRQVWYYCDLHRHSQTRKVDSLNLCIPQIWSSHIEWTPPLSRWMGQLDEGVAFTPALQQWICVTRCHQKYAAYGSGDCSFSGSLPMILLSFFASHYTDRWQGIHLFPWSHLREKGAYAEVGISSSYL